MNDVDPQLEWSFAFAYHPQRDLALRYADGSMPAPRRYRCPTAQIHGSSPGTSRMFCLKTACAEFSVLDHESRCNAVQK
jgi:hypothetical protein